MAFCRRLCDRRAVSDVVPIPGSRRLVVLARGLAFGMAVALALIEGTARDQALTLLALGSVAALASLAATRPAMSWTPVVEGSLVATIVGFTTPVAAFALPYLLVPALEAGLLWGLPTVISTVAVSVFALAVGPLATQQLTEPRAYLASIAQWLALALAVGAVAAWARRLRRPDPDAMATASYVAAYRLLSQLRAVSRQLIGGLDAYTLGQALLETLRATLPYTRAALFARSEGGRLVPLAYAGVGRVDWVPTLDDESAWAEAWTSGVARRQRGTFSDEHGGYAAVLPLRVGVRVIGLVGMERLEAPFTQEQLAQAVDVVDEAALRIETALLFAEVRQIATAEERRRLAREIHDGIAQELASLGYLIDDMSYRTDNSEQKESLQHLRGELTRIISELRLSIFDLRSEVHAATGLGAALSDYVRGVGATSDLTVHLVLDEAPQRLRIEAEGELLRIAQEAVTNVRKHARAENLWVTCRTAPPKALLRIEDDGLGLGRARADSYGMDIMRERAARLGAHLQVSDRPGGGTVVEISVGGGRHAAPTTTEDGGHVHDRAAR